MFFPKLRRRAKWAFVLIIVAFAASTVLFGVGTGYGGLNDLFQMSGTAGPSASEARDRIEDNPRDAQAYRDLSTALQAEQKIAEAIPPLQKYIELRPTDADAQRELSGLYLRQARDYEVQVQIAQLELQQVTPGTTFLPPESTQLGKAIGTDPISQTLSTGANERLNESFMKMQASYRNAVGALKKLAKQLPLDASVQFELAQAAEAANDTETAIAAYERFLKLAPEDPSAQAVRERVKQLRATAVQPTAGG